MNKFFSKKESPLLNSNGAKSLYASILSIIIGLLAGAILIIVVGLTNKDITFKSSLDAIKLVFFGLFSTGRDLSGELTFGFNSVNFGNLLFRATPVIMTGLSVCVAFKTGLFNIGAPGQYLIGTAATLFFALTLPTETLSSAVVWIIAFLFGSLFGGLWGAIPGYLKAKFNINEVLSCIMTNWIAANLVTAFFENSSLKNSPDSGKTGYIMPTIKNGVATAKLGLDKIFHGSQINAGILVAVVICIVIYFIMNKTILGYELQACGSNKFAAKYAGIKDKRNIVLSMAIAGSLSGAGAALYYLSGNTEFFWSTYQALPSEGFNGIPIALLASNNPIAVIFTGCFMSMLNITGQELKNLTTYNEHISDIIIAVIVYLSSFSLLIKQLLSSRKDKIKNTSSPVGNSDDEEILSELSEKNYDKSVKTEDEQ